LYRNYAPIVLFCVKILIPLFIYFSGDMVTDYTYYRKNKGKKNNGLEILMQEDTIGRSVKIYMYH
jgi:hypothetical protein